jgi:cytoskeletal protein CcmA (bactofilin family)
MSFFGTRRQADVPSQPTLEKHPLPKPSIPTSPVGFETVLGANSSLEGVLRSSSNVRLDGAFSGTLEINGNVLVGETAKITADINARNISIAGAVRGNVSGKKVQLLRTGRIWGDIKATALTTEEGAFIDGKITMVSHEAASSVSDTVPVEQAEEEADAVTHPEAELEPADEVSEVHIQDEVTEEAPPQDGDSELPSPEQPSV